MFEQSPLTEKLTVVLSVFRKRRPIHEMQRPHRGSDARQTDSEEVKVATITG